MKGKVLMIAVCIALVIGIAISCRADVKTERAEYIVKSGDTLWSIANEYAPKGTDKREYIFNIQKDNGLATSEIYPNMVLEIVKETK
jgi:nucleoid-associated protein YgaU